MHTACKVKGLAKTDHTNGINNLFNITLCAIVIILLYYTVETAYKVYVCPRGNLLYMRIYLITDLKLL